MWALGVGLCMERFNGLSHDLEHIWLLFAEKLSFCYMGILILLLLLLSFFFIYLKEYTPIMESSFSLGNFRCTFLSIWNVSGMRARLMFLHLVFFSRILLFAWQGIRNHISIDKIMMLKFSFPGMPKGVSQKEPFFFPIFQILMHEWI